MRAVAGKRVESEESEYEMKRANEQRLRLVHSVFENGLRYVGRALRVPWFEPRGSS